MVVASALLTVCFLVWRWLYGRKDRPWLVSGAPATALFGACSTSVIFPVPCFSAFLAQPHLFHPPPTLTARPDALLQDIQAMAST